MRQLLPDLPTGILDGLLDLTFLPARRRIAEFRLEQIVADHGREAQVDLTDLATPNTVHRRLHIVENTTTRHPAKDAKGFRQRIEQHLVGLQRIGPQNEGSAVG